MTLFLFVLFITLAVGRYYYVTKVLLLKKPAAYPFVRVGQKSNKPVVLFLGDSNTQGNMGYNWVDKLIEQWPLLQIFNAGINADLSFTLLRRIDEHLEYLAPDVVFLLIGTNDVNATMSQTNLQRYLTRGKIEAHELPNKENFEANYRRILSKLVNRSKVFLITLPIMSENLNHPANKKSEDYSELIKRLGEEYGCQIIDFRKEQIGMLQNKHTKKPYEVSRKMMDTATVLRYFLGLKWNTIASIFGNELTHDQIHLNEKSGEKLLEMLNDQFKIIFSH